MNVVIAGGGTAGHVTPALALARCLVEDHGAEVRFLGTERGPEARLVRGAGYPFTSIEARPFVRKVSLSAAAAPIAAVRSVRTCRPDVEASDVVVGMGGYVSVPAVLAAARSRRPVVLHEQNAVPGLAVRVFARLARTVAISFPETAASLPARSRGRIVVTGNPVRGEIVAVRGSREALRKEALGELDLEEGRRTILVFGGSQGALHLNRATVDAVAIMEPTRDLQVVLLTGAAHLAAVERTRPGGDMPLRTLPYLDRMELGLASADVVVARAGATSIAEITACGVPAVLIPYPYAANREQDANARAVQEAGAAIVVKDEDLTGEALAKVIRQLIDDPERRAAMSERALAWSRPEAAEALARVVVEAGEG